MTHKKNLKKLVRERMKRTGESYTSSLHHFITRSGPSAARLNWCDTAALYRVFLASGIRSIHTEKPLSEAMLFGLGGGIGAAYFVFQYGELSTFYIGTQINSFVQKGEFVEKALERSGVKYQSYRTASSSAAHKKLESVLKSSWKATLTVDATCLSFHALDEDLKGMMPFTVSASEIKSGKIGITALAPHQIFIDSTALKEARGRIRSSKNLMCWIEERDRVIDLQEPIRNAIQATINGFKKPPMVNFGFSGLEKWAKLASDEKDKKSWAKVFSLPEQRYLLLQWLLYWIESSGTGGDGFRSLYAEFLSEAATILKKPGLKSAAKAYRNAGKAWKVIPDLISQAGKPFGRVRELLLKKQELLAVKGVTAADEIRSASKELYAIENNFSRDPSLSQAEALALFKLIGEQVLKIHRAERDALQELENNCS